MTFAEIEMSLARLKSSAPPNDLETIKFVSSLPWSGGDSPEVWIYTEIVLRLTAEAIMIKFSKDDDLKNKYKIEFTKIIENTKNGDLTSNSEFDEYYLKFKEIVLSI